MYKKFMCFVVVLIFVFSFIGTPISAWAAVSYVKNDVKCVGLEAVEYKKLDEDIRSQVDEVLEQNDIAQEDVLGIYRYDNDENTERITIPGWIVLSGQWISAYEWRFIVTNAGTGTVNAYTTKVQLINKSYGPVTREVINPFPGLLPGQSDSSTYRGAVATVDIANYNIRGTVNNGQHFEMSGADVR